MLMKKYLAVISGKQNDFNRIWDKWGTALEEIHISVN